MAGKKQTESGSGRTKRDSSKSRQKSPARRDASKSPVKSKSPARNKSPGRRSPGRPKKGSSPSPARSPSRRSPSRNAAIKGQEKVKSLCELLRFITVDCVSYLWFLVKVASDGELSDSDNLELIQEVKEKPKAAVRGRTRHVDVDRDRFKVR